MGTKGIAVNFSRSTRIICSAAAIAAASLVTNRANAAGTLLYQWDFNGASAEDPTVTAGGGTLSVTNNGGAAGAFVSSGGLQGGGALDLRNGQTYGTASPSTFAGTPDAGSALTGLGVQNQITVTMWYKLDASVPTSGLTTPYFGRLLNLGATQNYDIYGTGTNGISMMLHANAPTDTTLKYLVAPNGDVAGSNDHEGPDAPSDQWVFLAFSYDAVPNGNPYYDVNMRNVTGNVISANGAVYVGSESASPTGTGASIVNASAGDYGGSSGSIDFGASAYMYLGNNPATGDAGFKGLIDDVRVYSGLMGPSDLESVRRAGLGIAGGVNAQWKKNGSGTWSTGANWNLGVAPASVNDTVEFGSFGGVVTSPVTVTVGNATTVGTVTFSNTAPYTIAGTGTLTVDAPGTFSPSINVTAGNHVISAPFNTSRDSTITIAANSSLNITNLKSQYQSLTKAGDGTLEIAHFQDLTLLITGGTVKFTPVAAWYGYANQCYYFGPGDMAGRLDLTNTTLINEDGGTTALADNRARLLNGFNNGAWNGGTASITSSTAAAVNATNANKLGVGYSRAGDAGIGVYDNRTVGATNIIFALTYLGDTNLDRTVDSSDFDRLVAAYGITDGTAVWLQGDFNYDGKVNTADFNYLAGNFGQTLSAPPAAPTLGALVPEPASLSLLALGGLLGLKRTRGSLLCR